MADVICKKLFVLITDDSEEDSFLIERALRESARFQVIASVGNGEETITYLAGRGQYADRQLWPFPDVLLMHLKRGRAESLEIVEWLQRSPFTDLKVAVLSGSAAACKIRSVGASGELAFCAGSAHHGKLKELVFDLEKLLLACGPNGEVTIAAFHNNQ